MWRPRAGRAGVSGSSRPRGAVPVAVVGIAALAVMFLAYAGLVWRNWSRDKKVAEARFTISNLVETGGSRA